MITKDLIIEAHLLLVPIVIIYLVSCLLVDLVALHLDAFDSVLRIIVFLVSIFALLWARCIGPIALSLGSASFRCIIFASTKHIFLVVLVCNFGSGFALWSSFLTPLLNT